jgi:hypothetical protein
LKEIKQGKSMVNLHWHRTTVVHKFCITDCKVRLNFVKWYLHKVLAEQIHRTFICLVTKTGFISAAHLAEQQLLVYKKFHANLHSAITCWYIWCVVYFECDYCYCALYLFETINSHQDVHSDTIFEYQVTNVFFQQDTATVHTAYNSICCWKRVFLWQNNK